MGQQDDRADAEQLLFAAWTRPEPSDRAIAAHMERNQCRPLIEYLRSSQEIPLNLRLYLADVLEQLTEPKRGAPKKSIGRKYSELARNDRDIAAVFANEIVRLWRENGHKNRGPDGRPINLAACKQAIEILKERFPGQFRLEVNYVEERMRLLKDFRFRRLVDELKIVRSLKPAKVQNNSPD